MSCNPVRPTFRKVLIAAVFGVGLFLVPTGAQSAVSNSATLSWTPNQEPDLGGYRVYHGTTPGIYAESLNAGNTSTYRYASLASNKTHYFTVTAYDTSGNESLPSPEVYKTIVSTDSLLSVSVNGEGTVTSSPAGLSCSSGTCSGSFTQGSTVTLTATPGSGSTFGGWNGSCTGTSNCAITIASLATVSAAFSSSTPTASRSLSVSLLGDGLGSVTSNPSGLSCSGGTCNASFPEGTTVTLTPTTQSGNIFQGWNGICSGTSSCAVTLSASQVVTATFASEDSNPSPPKPTLPILINFQPSASQTPTNFKKDDGSLFSNTRGYGWNQLLNGTEQNSTADQTLDTFVSAANENPSTWNFSIPNGIYYVTMVLGNATTDQGPHWVSVEGFQLAKQVPTASGEYLAIVDYSVEVKDSILSLTLGNSGQGETTLNYLVINESPNLSNTTQILTKSFGTSLITSVFGPGTATKIDPVDLVKKDHEEKKQIAIALAKKEAIAQERAIAQEKAIAQRKQIKEREVATLNVIKEKMVTKRKADGAVTLRNLLGGS